MLGDGFTSFSLFLNELKQSQELKRWHRTKQSRVSISQAQRVVMSNEISLRAFQIYVLASQGVTWALHNASNAVFA